MKVMADQHKTEKSLQIGDWVWLKLQCYIQTSVSSRGIMKLEPKYFGPFLILDKVGQVAYKLAFPAKAMIHPAVHISQLKSFHGQLPQQPYFCKWMRGIIIDPVLTPYKILAGRKAKRQKRPIVQYLVQWVNHIKEQATWMFVDVLKTKYREFQLTN